MQRTAHEVGDIISEIDSIVVDIRADDPYKDEQYQYPHTKPVQVHDDGSITVDGWDELNNEAQTRIQHKHEVRI